MSTKIIVLALAFAAAVVAGGIGYHYGPNLLNDADPRERVAAEPEAGSEPDAEPAISAEGGVQDAEVAAAPQPAGEAESADLVAPSFDIIRVEPTGELLAAGRAAPGASVDLLLGDEPLVSDESNVDGEWAVIPVAPLPVGEHEIVLRATGANGEGGPIEGDRATVIINGSSDSPVIAIARPGETAQIFQQRDEVAAAGEAPSGPALAMDEPGVDAAEDPAVAREEVDAVNELAARPESQLRLERSTGSAGSDVELTPEVATADAPLDEGVVDLGERRAAGDQAPDRQIAEEAERGAPEATPAPLAAEEPFVELALRSTAKDEGAAPPSSAGEPNEADILAALPATEEAPERSSEHSVAPALDIRTVEVTEIGEARFTGRAEPGSIVRLYVNDQELDEAVAEASGAWRATGVIELPPGRYLARADIVDGAGEVRASARLRFDRVRIEMAEAGSEGARPARQSAALGAGDSGAREVAPADVARNGETVTSRADAERAEAGEEPLSGGTEAVSARPEAAPDGRSAGEGTIETRVVAAPAAALSEAPTQALSEGPEAIYIQRGDNLWRIARSIYGRGIQYQRIYEANRSQIRNPHLIFPGQVFTIPLPDEDSE